MARSLVPATPIVGPYPSLPLSANALDLTWTAAQANGTPANEDYIQWAASKMLLLVRNTDGASAYYFTLNSAPDALKRSGDIEQFDVGAGEVAAFLIEQPGWLQAGDQIHLEAENAAIEYAVIPLN